jgi:hypothetical protein
MPRRAEWILAEEFILDGIAYTITTKKSRNRFQAKWMCKCGAAGEPSISSGTKKEAIGRAKVNLTIHHSLVHTREISTDLSDIEPKRAD